MDKVGMAKNKNRRVSFRIYDEVNLFYKKIDEKPVTELPLTTELEWVSQDSVWLLPSVKKDLPDVTMPDLQFNENDIRNVNISASGMAFSCDDALKEGDYLAIKILLVSSMVVILAYCKVVYCRDGDPSDSQHPYLVGTHFTSMTDTDRELLIKHVDKQKVKHIVGRGLILTTVITVIAAPGAVFDLLSGLLHFLVVHFFEFCDIAFELIETGLDHLIEHFFHTDLHQTQVIVFYIIVSFIIYGFYRLWRALPPFCQRCKKNQIAYWSRKKASLRYYWREQLLFNKIKLVVIGVAAITLYISFGF
jgi:hypothetical protein